MTALIIIMVALAIVWCALRYYLYRLEQSLRRRLPTRRYRVMK